MSKINGKGTTPPPQPVPPQPTPTGPARSTSTPASPQPAPARPQDSFGQNREATPSVNQSPSTPRQPSVSRSLPGTSTPGSPAATPQLGESLGYQPNQAGETGEARPAQASGASGVPPLVQSNREQVGSAIGEYLAQDGHLNADSAENYHLMGWGTGHVREQCENALDAMGARTPGHVHGGQDNPMRAAGHQMRQMNREDAEAVANRAADVYIERRMQGMSPEQQARARENIQRALVPGLENMAGSGTHNQFHPTDRLTNSTSGEAWRQQQEQEIDRLHGEGRGIADPGAIHSRQVDQALQMRAWLNGATEDRLPPPVYENGRLNEAATRERLVEHFSSSRYTGEAANIGGPASPVTISDRLAQRRDPEGAADFVLSLHRDYQETGCYYETYMNQRAETSRYIAQRSAPEGS